jgi:hypothetical protein
MNDYKIKFIIVCMNIMPVKIVKKIFENVRANFIPIKIIFKKIFNNLKTFEANFTQVKIEREAQDFRDGQFEPSCTKISPKFNLQNSRLKYQSGVFTDW